MADSLRYGTLNQHGQYRDDPTPEQIADIDAVAALLGGMTAADGTNYLDIFREATSLEQK